MSTATLFYVHDPMCSWCWAFRPSLLQLRSKLPKSIVWQNVLGGLAADNDQPMPEQTRNMVQGHWRQIQSTIGTEFNFDFWIKCQPRRDTYKACRAVIAASNQAAEEVMIEAIQKAYYLRAMNPSDPKVLLELAVELGLDGEQFEVDLGSIQSESSLQEHFSLRRSLDVWSFPSLVLKQGSTLTPIVHDYKDFRVSLAEIQSGLLNDLDTQ